MSEKIDLAKLWFKSGTAQLLCFLLAAAAMALYAPTAWHGYINYDDGAYVFDNAHVSTGLSRGNLAWALRAVCVGNWHPLTLVSYMIDCQIFGVTPGPQHLVNALWHSANTGLLFLALMRMTHLRWRSALVAGLFGLHPAHVESVAWIAERKDVLSGFFFMLTLWSYTSYALTRRDGRTEAVPGCQPGIASSNRRSALWYSLTWVFLALGLMSKPMLVTTPFLLLLLDYWPLNRIARLADLWPRLLEKLPFFGLSAASCALTLWAQGGAGAVVSLAALPLQSRLASAAASYVFYLGKLFWPVKLMIPYVPEASLNLVVPWVNAGALVAATILILWLGLRWRYLAAGWLWYLGALVPVIGFVQVGIQSAADRYTYLPAIGIFTLVVWGGADLMAACRVPRLVTALVSAGLLGTCGFLTARQVGYWQSSKTLFLHSVQVDPTNLPAWNCLAGAYAADPDPAVRNGAEALRLARACVKLTERREPAYLMTLAAAYAELRQFGNAIETSEEALRLLDPGSGTDMVRDFKADLELYKSGKTLSDRYLVSGRPNKSQSLQTVTKNGVP